MSGWPLPPVAELLVKALLVMVALPSLSKPPPSPLGAELWSNVLSMISTVPLFWRPPPLKEVAIP